APGVQRATGTAGAIADLDRGVARGAPTGAGAGGAACLFRNRGRGSSTRDRRFPTTDRRLDGPSRYRPTGDFASGRVPTLMNTPEVQLSVALITLLKGVIYRDNEPSAWQGFL